MSEERLFDVPGDMAALMRALDWSKTPLGQVSTWSPALRTTVGLMLRNRFPMLLWWGPEFVQLYNDAYQPIPGAKHPRSLGQMARECWSEIWHIIGPMVEAPFSGGPATASDDLFLLIDRSGFLEETHFIVSYSPVPDESVPVTGIGGVLATVAETTEQVLGERQLRTLRELGARAPEAKTAEQACSIAAATLAQDASDVPFALFYLLEPDGKRLRLLCSCGFENENGSANPREISLAAAGDSSAWCLRAVVEQRQIEVFDDLRARFEALPSGRWAEPPRAAIGLPLATPDQPHVYGVLIAGISPHRALNESYRGFFELAAGQVVTAIRNARAYDEERIRAEKLAEIDRAKTLFFSNVSHEFRTPLTLMLGPVEDGLADTENPLAARQRERQELVHRSGLRLQKLVNTLLDFARIEAGRARASFEPTDLASLTADLASSFRSALERGGLRLEVDCPPLPEPVYVDREMWEKIVLNLLSNAFKFTFEGSVGVRLRALRDQIELEVRDSGVGIAAHELPRVFERFHRGEGTRSRTHEGSGIGLALAQDLVKLHGGSIRVDSEQGRGTTFRVSIPAGASHLPADRIGAPHTFSSSAVRAEAYVAEAMRWLPGNAREPAPLRIEAESTGLSAALRSARVLVADDNADMREYISRLLRPHWTVETAADGMEALDAIRVRRPDLILADVMMPNLDGFGLLRAIRADSITADISVLMLSARAGEESRIEGLHAGADDYLVKPFSGRELLARVGSQLALGRLRSENAQERRLLLEREQTARKEAELLRGEAENANRTKDAFLAMLGHELRNPLAPILTAVQLLKLRGNELHELSVIDRQVGHLVRLVDDLLDISRITGGKVELRRERFELAAAALRGLEMASPLLEQRRQRIELEIRAEGLMIEGDRQRLAQVVANLLTNAAKYSDPGSRIQMTAKREADVVRLCVRDTGIGIPADMLEKVFEMFVQEAQPLDRSKGGLGLGLAIVRSLVELHGGNVKAVSEGPGKGSEFIVELPAAANVAEFEGATAGGLQAPLRTPAVARERNRVLVVDDNEDAAEVLASALTDLGYAVAVAHDGPEALVTAATFQPNIALLDIGLPVMDGYELARRLQSDRPRPQRPHLVAITGYGQENDRERSTAAGFREHVVKPVDLDELERIVAALSAES